MALSSTRKILMASMFSRCKHGPGRFWRFSKGTKLWIWEFRLSVWVHTVSPHFICAKPFCSCRENIRSYKPPRTLEISGSLWPDIMMQLELQTFVLVFCFGFQGKRDSPAKSYTCYLEVLWQARNWAGVKRNHSGCFFLLFFKKQSWSFKPCEKKSLLNIPLWRSVLIQAFILSLIPGDIFLFSGVSHPLPSHRFLPSWDSFLRLLEYVG